MQADLEANGPALPDQLEADPLPHLPHCRQLASKLTGNAVGGFPAVGPEMIAEAAGGRQAAQGELIGPLEKDGSLLARQAGACAQPEAGEEAGIEVKLRG